MAIHTPLIINAAYAGFIAGSQVAAKAPAAPSTLVSAAQAFAAAVDAAIPADTALETGGATIAASALATAAETNAFMSKLVAVIAIGFSYGFQQANAADGTQADYSSAGTAIAAMYAALVAGLPSAA